MGRISVSGNEAGAFLDSMLTRPASQLNAGLSQLCIMCSENGGILDDLIVYKKSDGDYLLVMNGANLQWNLDWLHRWLERYAGVSMIDMSADTVMVAVQGPAACQMQCMAKASGLPRFGHMSTAVGDISATVARTGYTGEDGFEIIAGKKDAHALWNLLMAQGAAPCGLAARDSLRLEAGMLLNGQDMDPDTNPYEAGLGWLVDVRGSEFMGREALLSIKSHGVGRKLVGFQMKGREIARTGYAITLRGQVVGKVTSGGYSPTLNINIGLGYVPVELSAIGADIEISIREKVAGAAVVKKPFYRREERVGS
jgi:aminomethyltransferase